MRGRSQKGLTRRGFVAPSLGLLSYVAMTRPSTAAKKPESLPPQPGDRFLITKGDLKGELLRPGLLTVNEPPVVGFPIDPVTETPRRKNRLNRLLLIKLEPEEMDEPTRAAAAQGVLVYSAICTHRVCTISSWKRQERHLRCHCHLSEFAALSEGSVRGGPARKPLPFVPLTIDDAGLVAAAEGFNRKPGFKAG